MNTLAAYLYTLLALLPISVQLALAAGAPLGHLTLAGKWPGKLPARMRPVALLQSSLLAAMAWTMLSHAGVVHTNLPNWGYGAAMGLTILTFLTNSITPSRPERCLWQPVTGAMVFTGLLVGFF